MFHFKVDHVCEHGTCQIHCSALGAGVGTTPHFLRKFYMVIMFTSVDVSEWKTLLSKISFLVNFWEHEGTPDPLYAPALSVRLTTAKVCLADKA